MTETFFPPAPHEAAVSAIDRRLHAFQGRLTLGVSPASVLLAYLDWALHLANSPGKQLELVDVARRKWRRLGEYAARWAIDHDTPPEIEPLPQDHRFTDPAWRQWPFNFLYQAFLLQQQWWHNATTGVRGVSPHHEDVVAFGARQMLDVFAPTNFLLTNPTVLEATAREGGANLVRGWVNFVRDVGQTISQARPAEADDYPVGKKVAITPGKVVYRNRLMELIQYSPTTETVHAEPILIMSAWIMKYYILDLSPENSMIRYLVDQGHTVFTISWHNPGEADRDLEMDDYLTLGLMEALAAVNAIVPGRRIHTVGYCLGGMLLTIGAATMAGAGDDRLASITLFAAQTDVEEPGELSLFVDESQVAFLEDIMWEQGYLDGSQMAGAFQLLRSNDLLWSRVVQEYMLGRERRLTDLMTWNTDLTRMPYRMHASYLKRIFLRNELAHGEYEVGGRPVPLTDIRVPMFVVGTELDHVAPWKSVYKLHLLADTEITFLLTSGGHNAGVVSEPGHPNRWFRVATHREGDKYVDPETWEATTPVQQGSWWPTWQEWLAHLSTDRVPPPSMGAPARGYPPLADAPGSYVLEP